MGIGTSLTVGWREMGMAEWAPMAAVFAAPAPVQPAAVGTANPDPQDFSVWLYYFTSAA